MHEIGIAQDVLDAVFKELKSHRYEKINKIKLSVGESNLLTPESLQNAFDLVSVNTRADGALLEIEQVPGMQVEIIHIEAE